VINDIQEVLLSADQIATRVKEIGDQISADYAGEEILMIGVLRGAVIFMSDLARSISIPVAIDFMAVSSYGASTTSSGIVRILKDLDEEVAGRHLLVVEDRRKKEVHVDYNGFTIPDHFVVGYGLDYAEKYRNLPFIGILKPEAYEGK